MLQRFVALKQGDKFIGKEDVYFIDGISKKADISIDLCESKMNFIDEIEFERKLELEKEYFDDYVKDMYDWYTLNEKREACKALNSLKKDLLLRFNTSLNKRIDTLSSPMAVPLNKPYIVTEEEMDKILNSETDPEIVKTIKENA